MADRDDDVRAPSPPFRVGEWCVEPTLNAIRCGETTRHLEPKVMDALVALARSGGGVVTKSELTDAVWQLPFISENRLVGVIASLRRALGDDVNEPRYVQTIPTRGYRLAVPVEWDGGEAAREPERTARFTLETADETYRLHEGVNIVGREAEADIRIASDWVSRRHARLEVQGESVVLEDLGSKNGTFVNSGSLTGRVQLQDVDEIRLGRAAVVLRFRASIAATRTESLTPTDPA